MPSPPLLDFDALLAVIPGDDPAGSSVPFEVKEKLEEFRKEVDPESFDKKDPTRPENATRADWPAISKLAQQTLRETSKDLLVAARLTEALVKLHGVAGIRDGFQLLRLMVDQCWDRMYPVIETPDDLEVRAGPFNWIDHPTKSARFPWSVRMVPLIGRDKDRYSWQQWKESLSGKGPVTSADIDRAITASSRESCEQIVEDLNVAWQEIELLLKALNAKMASEAPGLTSVREALNDCRALAQQILQKKGGAAPAATVGTEGATGAPAENPVEKKMATRADVYSTIAQAAAVLQQLEPHSPIPYLLNRAVELGSLPFPDLMKNLILNADVVKLMNRELGIKDTPEKK
jgi:type VI secretion system protein ImpA